MNQRGEASLGFIDRSLRIFYNQCAQFEIAWTALLFLYWSKLILRATLSTRLSRARKFSHRTLVLHVISSLTELLFYYIPLGTSGAIPSPTIFYLGLCVAQCVTSLQLTAALGRSPQGHLHLARATFLCMVIQRLLASGIAVYTGSAAWQKASVKLLHNFVWARIFIVRVPRYVSGLDSYDQKYTAGIVACHLMGLWEGSYPNGVAI